MCTGGKLARKLFSRWKLTYGRILVVELSTALKLFTPVIELIEIVVLSTDVIVGVTLC